MNNTDNSGKIPEKSIVWEARQPLVDESTFMTEEEVKTLITGLLQDADYNNYALDGLLFLFNTIFEMANQNQRNLMDLCSEVKRMLYIESSHCSTSEEVYVNQIHDFYRKTDYSDKDGNHYKSIRAMVGLKDTKPESLDKSNELEDLSLKLSEVLKHPDLPAKLYNVITDEISEVYVDTDSPENILKNLESLIEKEGKDD